MDPAVQIDSVRLASNLFILLGIVSAVVLVLTGLWFLFRSLVRMAMSKEVGKLDDVSMDVFSLKLGHENHGKRLVKLEEELKNLKFRTDDHINTHPLCKCKE